MYEQLSHAILNEILAELNLEIEKQELHIPEILFLQV